MPHATNAPPETRETARADSAVLAHIGMVVPAGVPTGITAVPRTVRIPSCSRLPGCSKIALKIQPNIAHHILGQEDI